MLQLTRRTVVIRENIEATTRLEELDPGHLWTTVVLIYGKDTRIRVARAEREVMVTKCTTERNNWQRVKDWTHQCMVGSCGDSV